MAGNRKQTAQYRANRAALLEGSPDCYWGCGRPATQADHLLEHDAGGDDSSANLVPACQKCNSSRGAQYVNRKTTARQAARNEALNKPPKITENPVFLGEVITD
jgi:5-methylcytosine-specific restriction endonuclease McrA